MSRPTLISCIFCNFEMAFDAALGQGGYIQHLQGWHHITLEAEIERAMLLALKIKGDEEGRWQIGDEADMGDEHDTRGIVVTVQNSEALKAASEESEDTMVIKAEKGAAADARNVINGLKKKRAAPVKEQPFCDKCGKKFGKDVILQDHMRVAHGAPRLFCGGLRCHSHKCFFSLQSYNDHVQKVHLGEKGFECPYRECEQKFVLGERGDHLRLAHSARGLECTHANCDRTFKRKSDRKSHMRSVHAAKC